MRLSEARKIIIAKYTEEELNALREPVKRYVYQEDLVDTIADTASLTELIESLTTLHKQYPDNVIEHSPSWESLELNLLVREKDVKESITDVVYRLAKELQEEEKLKDKEAKERELLKELQQKYKED